MKTVAPDHMIFVFGSNIAGIHGAGAAFFAAEHKGARYGQGMGFFGQSYAIPTKCEQVKTLPLFEIGLHIAIFKNYARRNWKKPFQITRIGCGLAGYKDSQIAPMFRDITDNCFLPVEWWQYYPKHPSYWETPNERHA